MNSFNLKSIQVFTMSYEGIPEETVVVRLARPSFQPLFKIGKAAAAQTFFIAAVLALIDSSWSMVIFPEQILAQISSNLVQAYLQMTCQSNSASVECDLDAESKQKPCKHKIYLIHVYSKNNYQQ